MQHARNPSQQLQLSHLSIFSQNTSSFSWREAQQLQVRTTPIRSFVCSVIIFLVSKWAEMHVKPGADPKFEKEGWGGKEQFCRFFLRVNGHISGKLSAYPGTQAWDNLKECGSLVPAENDRKHWKVTFLRNWGKKGFSKMEIQWMLIPSKTCVVDEFWNFCGHKVTNFLLKCFYFFAE